MADPGHKLFEADRTFNQKVYRDEPLIPLRGLQGDYNLAKPLKSICLEEVCEAIGSRRMPKEFATLALTATSRRLLSNMLAGVEDDGRRHLTGFTLDALKLSK